MKILSIGSSMFTAGLRDRGHRVILVTNEERSPHPDTIKYNFFQEMHECHRFIGNLVHDHEPDIILQGDRSTPIIHCGLENIDIPKAWYAIDAHLHISWYKHFAAGFDHLFCAQKNMIGPMSCYTQKAEWLPLFSGESTPFSPWASRTIPVAFVGNLDTKTNPQRVHFFNTLRAQSIQVHFATGLYAPIYSISKIVVNQSAKNDLNLRFFEATGCGALLVTDRLTHSMQEILIEGEDFLCFESGNATDCAEKIRWALANEQKAEAMARRAYDKIIAGHLEKHRIIQVEERLSSLLSPNRTVALDRSFTFAHFAWAHFCCSQLSLPSPITSYFFDRSKELALAGRASTLARAWALLVLATHEMQNNNVRLVSSLLAQIQEVPDDPDFKMFFCRLKIESLVFSGYFEVALEELTIAQREFPETLEFIELETLVKRRIG